MTFANDIDLLHWEPNILKDAAFASQTLISGTGNLAASTFTISAGSFTTSHVTNDLVIVLAGSVAGSFPIVSVDGATQLTISTLYDGLFPSSGDPAASPVGTANGLTYTIRTFWPQRRIVSELLLQAAGLDPTDDAAATIVNPQSLRRPCALGTLQMIYSALAAASAEPEALNVRAEIYQRLYRRALRSVTIEIDRDGDGEGDIARGLNVMSLQRI
jgi:hypothetical protein